MTPEAQSVPIFISEIEQFGGAERALLALSRWLHEHGISNYLLTYFDHADFGSYALHSLQVVALQPAPGVRNKMAALKRHFAQRPIHAPAPIFSGYQPSVHGTLAGIRGFHCLMHDTPSLFGDQATRDLKARLRIAVSNQIVGWGLRSGGATIVTSEYLRAECRRDFGVDAKIARMGGLSNDLAIASPGQKSRRPQDRLNMLSVCRIEANKRIDWLLRSLAALEHRPTPLSHKVDWHLDLAGKGSMIDELTRLAATLKIAERVRFRGFVSDENLETLYADADLFLMPAVQGYGIPAIEALRRKIPVLLHRESGVSDILLDTPWATVLEGGEAELTPLLAQAVEGVLSGRHVDVPPPSLPTEDEWAQQVAAFCGYISPQESPCR